YPRESSFDLESYSDSDYAGANLDRKSTTEGCQFLGRRLITWQCKKQTIVATSTIEAKYVAAASCCGQVLWVQNQMSPKPIRIHFNRPITHAISSTDILNLQALISLTDDLSLRSNMAALESCPKHNMLAYLEKTEGNVEFHEVIDFLQRSYISHALTVSPVVSTTFVEQFWTSAKSKTINNVRHITAKVAGKLVSISEASIRTDLLFNDADGIDTLPNQAIFDTIQLMGYEGDLTVLTFNKALFSPQWRHLEAKKKFVMYPRFISIFLARQLVNVTLPLDYFPDEGCLPQKGLLKHQPSPPPSPEPTCDAANVSLPDSSFFRLNLVMLQFEQQPDLSTQSFTQTFTINPYPLLFISTDLIPEHTGENLGIISFNVLDQAKEIKLLKAKITKLKKNTDEKMESNNDHCCDSESGSLKVLKRKLKVPSTPFYSLFLVLKLLSYNSVLESDEELARKVQEEWEAEEEKNKIAEEQATNEALIKDFDDIKARIEADRILAEKLQEQEREQFTIEERAKFLHDTIAAQRKFLAQTKITSYRNKPKTKIQIRKSNDKPTFKHEGKYGATAKFKLESEEEKLQCIGFVKIYQEGYLLTLDSKETRSDGILAGEISLLNLSFKASVRVVLGHVSSYFTLSSLQLDLRDWKLE
ncbi:hypothetical protein Tco_1124085, partial [Tanacetum coccineum]